jgi:RNA polymerase sigma factor (sigma-70 family)
MPTPTDRLLRCIRRIASQAGPEPNDSEVLARYLTDGDPVAFETLVTRHGPMVLRVCQHVLGNRHDAEDAFQATFLILARKAANVRPTGCLAGWLHGVASRVALGARTAARRRGAALTLDGAPRDPRPDPLAELTARDTLRVLEEEVQRLPEAYRLPVTLCCLHGLTQEEAARQLGWTPGSVKGRLERGRKRLQRRLTRRGLGLATALALVEVARATAAGPGGKLVASTALAAVAVASGNTAGTGLVSSEVLSLAQRGLTHVALAKGKFGLLLLFAVTLTAGLAALGHQWSAGGPLAMRPAPPDAEPPKPNDREQPTNAESQKRKEPRLDWHGDPLPEGALARLGTVRLRHDPFISGVVFSSDSKSILASDWYSGVHVWDAAEGKEIRRFFKEGERCFALALSPNGRTLAVSLGDGSVRLCDPRSGREFASLPKSSRTIYDLAFSPDGSLLATDFDGYSIRIWDVANQREVRKATFAKEVGGFSFSSNGKLLGCRVEGGIALWDLARGKEVRRLQNDPGGEYYLRAVFAPKGGRLAVWGYDDASIRLFDANGSKEIRRFQAVGAEKIKPPIWGWPTYISVSFSPNGKILATSRSVGRIDLWDVENGKKLHRLAFDSSHHAGFLEFSPDGTKLASTGVGGDWGWDNTIRVWDVTCGKELHPRAGHGTSITSIAISPNGKTVATAGRDGIIHLWEGRSGKHLLRLEADRGQNREVSFSSARQVSFSSDGQRVISWEPPSNRYRLEGGALQIWDARTGQAVSRLKLQGRDMFWAAVSDSGKTALSVDPKGNSLHFHDLATGKITHEAAYADNIWPVALSPASDKMLCSDGNLRSAADRKELIKVGVLGRPPVRFSADGRALVAAVLGKNVQRIEGLGYSSDEEEIAVIDPIEGKELRRFGERFGKLYTIDAIALSRDRKMVVTLGHSRNKSEEPIIKLWETETGRERGHFLGHRGGASSVAISADGRFVACGGQDTSALVWDATQPRTRNVSLRQESAALDLASHFENLAGEDAEQAYASMRALINDPKKTLSFLGDQNSLFTRTDVRAIQRWIRDLDSDTFAERERAAHELGLIVDEAESHLKKALQSKPSLEVRRRIDLLLEERSRGPTGKELQRFRVIEVLEHIAASSADTAEGADATQLAAIALLKKLAAGAAEARLTREAKASLERLE